MVNKEIVRKISAVIITILVMLMMFIVLFPPATSVYLDPGSFEDAVVCNESSITFSDVNLTIRGEERIPIDFLNFSIYNDATDSCVAYVTFTVTGIEIADNPNGKFSVVKTSTIPDAWYNYGYGYGYDEGVNNPFYFGYGYGYGYGDGSYTDITFLYDITFTTYQTGTFYTKFTVNSSAESTDHQFVSGPSTTFCVQSVPWSGDTVSATHAETISGSGTVNALEDASVSIDVTGSGGTTVMIANYSGNPDDEDISSTGFFFDAYVPDVSNATSITVKYWVKSALTGDYQRLYYLDSTSSSWKVCSNTGYTADTSMGSPYVGYNYAVITSLTQPCLNDLIGLPFYCGNETVTIALDPLAESYYTLGDQLDICGYILPGIENEDILIEVNDSSDQCLYLHVAQTNATGVFTDNMVFGGIDASDGTVTIYAAISGTSTQINQTCIYDNTDPSASLDAIASSVNSAPQISGSSSDAIALATVYVRLNLTNNTDTYYWDFDGGVWTTTNTWEPVTQTGTSDTWSLASSDPVDDDYDSNQLYTLSVYAVDQAGNSGSSSQDTFIFDTSPPTSTITTPAASAKLNALTEISGTATDTSGVNGVELQIINASSYYWNGASWVSEVTWLDATGTTSWMYDSSSVTWEDNGENAELTLKTRANDIVGNQETPSAGTSWTYGITTDVDPMETSNCGGAYRGAKINWTDVGMSQYKIYASLTDITNVSASGVTHVTTVSGTNTSSFSSLPATMWGEEVYYVVTTVDANGVEAPSTFLGATNHTHCWAYKMEVESPTNILHTTGVLGWTAHYKNRYLSGTINPVHIIHEFLGPNATGEVSIPNRPVFLATSQTFVTEFLETGSSMTQGTYAGGASGQNYKGWVMLWSRLPSQSGYWESYADVYEETPITIS